MKSIRVLLVCSIGGFIGSVIALEIYQGFWWIGTIVGALVAYLGYDIKGVVVVIKQAYDSTINWCPDRQYWSCWKKQYLNCFNFGTNLLIGLFFIPIVAAHNNSETGLKLSDFIDILKFFTYLVGGFGLASIGVTFKFTKNDLKERKGLINNENLKIPNFIQFYFWILPKEVLSIFMWLISKTPKGLMLIKKFLFEIFRLIHSEIRLLCAVNTAIGTAIGYFMGSAIIGAVAGGLLGFVAYEIITIKFLKLSGAKSLFRKFK